MMNSDTQKTYYIEAYGCQMNLYDGELIASILEEQGYRPAVGISDSDVVVVNTCSVRDHAERRALGRIRELAGLKKYRPKSRLVVCGCMAQRMGQDLLQRVPGVDLVVGTGQYKNLPDLLHAVHSGRVAAVPGHTGELYSRIVPRHRGGFSAFVAVMRGCDNRCTYCIVPSLRGPARSRPLADVLAEVRTLVEKRGVKEITFLGQNVNAYRDGRARFSDLLRAADQVDGLWRVRFVTSHPRDMSDEILDAMARSPKSCEHLHLPLQSGSDRILQAMRRGYTAQQYRALVARARQMMPEVSITTDLIAGFPGETEEDFQQTVEMMQTLQFDAAFTFQYSPRPGTEAEQLPGQLSCEVRHQRLRRLMAIQRQITDRVNQKMVDGVVEVLVESPSKRNPEEMMGQTRTHKMVIFPGGSDLVGRLVQVRIRSVRGPTARGTLQAACAARPLSSVTDANETLPSC